MAIAKELADLLYVVYGTAVSCGIDLEPIFREVHRSNMSKVGGHRRADGKWVKPLTYSPAVIEPLLAAQQREPVQTESAPSSGSLPLDVLAQRQGVTPVRDPDSLIALWPADDDPDQLQAYLLEERAARRTIARNDGT